MTVVTIDSLGDGVGKIMEPVTFARMTLADLEAVMRIERATFPSPWTEGMFKAEIFENPFSFPFIMKHTEEMVGYLIYWTILDEFHLMNLAVSPSWQRRGIGRAGLAWIKSRGEQEGAQRIILEVRASNLPACALYQKFGFYKVAVRKRYYEAPVEDALVLQCDLLQGLASPPPWAKPTEPPPQRSHTLAS